MTLSSGYITQCSIIPANAPAVMCTDMELVGRLSYTSAFIFLVRRQREFQFTALKCRNRLCTLSRRITRTRSAATDAELLLSDIYFVTIESLPIRMESRKKLVRSFVPNERDVIVHVDCLNGTLLELKRLLPPIDKFTIYNPLHVLSAQRDSYCT